MVASFTFDIGPHVAEHIKLYWLDRLRDTGADVEQVSDGRYTVTCTRSRQLEHVGWAMFHTALARIASRFHRQMGS
jgi:hypothetical protein